MGKVPLTLYDQYISSVSITSIPYLIYPYSSGVNLITKRLPSLPFGSNKPYLGLTVNSWSDVGKKYALNAAKDLFLLVNRNATLDYLPKGEEITIISSMSGYVASKNKGNFQTPPDSLLMMRSKLVLKGFRGLNKASNTNSSSCCI